MEDGKEGEEGFAADESHYVERLPAVRAITSILNPSERPYILSSLDIYLFTKHCINYEKSYFYSI